MTRKKGLNNESDIHNTRRKDKWYYVGAFMAFLGTIIGGLRYIAVQKLYDQFCDCTPELMVFYAGFGMLAVCFPIYGFNEHGQILSNQIVNIDGVTWISMVSIGFSCTIAFILLNQAIKMVDVVIVSFVRSIEIVLAFIIQIMLFHMIPSGTEVIGALCVVTSVVVIPLETAFVEKLPSPLKDIF